MEEELGRENGERKMEPSLGRGKFLQSSLLFNSPSISLTNPKSSLSSSWKNGERK
ncbi:hypothetical protein SESBI_36303 [Sesbania bispinosa]|nr:hypothetical protein SESBI_36303 [Sesbania bispinosa]